MAATQPYRTPTVYESTASGLPELRPYFAELRSRRRFIWHLARTDLKAEHYDSAIGQLWVILDPLLLAAVYFLSDESRVVTGQLLKIDGGWSVVSA